MFQGSPAGPGTLTACQCDTANIFHGQRAINVLTSEVEGDALVLEKSPIDASYRRAIRLTTVLLDPSTGQRWLSPVQFWFIYGLSRRSIYRMIRRGQLTVMRLGREWRILDPGNMHIFQTRASAEDTYILLSSEVASLLKIQPQSVRKLARRHRIKFRTIAGRRLYYLTDVRRILAARGFGQRRLRPGQTVREGIVRWAQKRLAEGCDGAAGNTDNS